MILFESSENLKGNDDKNLKKNNNISFGYCSKRLQKGWKSHSLGLG